MDSSKLPQGSDECSSNESGWTAYIASPEEEEDDDDEDDDQVRGNNAKQREEEDGGSDDSMASDASSGPSNQYGQFIKQFGYKHAKNTNERSRGGKKEKKDGDKKQHGEKMKAAKEKASSATRLRKK